MGNMKTQNYNSEKLTNAFKELKKYGYITRQNYKSHRYFYWHPDEQPKNEKYVYFSKMASCDGGTRYFKDYTVYIHWKGDGKLICETLKNAGLNVEWGGTKDDCIIVDNI